MSKADITADVLASTDTVQQSIGHVRHDYLQAQQFRVVHDSGAFALANGGSQFERTARVIDVQRKFNDQPMQFDNASATTQSNGL